MGASKMKVMDDECPFNLLPDVLISRIFSLLPARLVANTCTFVSKAWRDAAMDSVLWAHYCEESGLRPTDEMKQLGGWRALYIAVYGPNLVAAPCFEYVEQWVVERNKKRQQLRAWEPKHRLSIDRIPDEGDGCEEYHRYSFWGVEGGSQFHRGGGSGIFREKPPVECAPCPAAPDKPVIATSYDWGRVQQYIGFQSFPDKFLDACPPLLLSAWYAARRGSPGSFRMYVVFRDDLKNCKSIWDSGKLDAEEEWQQATFLIKGYPEGIRSVMVKIAGRSTDQKRGCYGTKFTNVQLNFVSVAELKFYQHYLLGSFMTPP